MHALVAVLLFSFYFIEVNSQQKIYYIAAEEILWDYAPSGRNLVSPTESDLREQNIEQHVYNKIIYKEYTDRYFNITKDSQEYLGFLGPILRVEVGDELIVIFNNTASHSLSIHPHGVPYTKANEGSAYDGQTGVSPGSSYRYSWNITEESGPQFGEGCISHLYHSDVDFIKDVNTGLFGFILVCSKDKVVKKDDDAFFYFGEIDENLSLLANETKDESNTLHNINGFVYANLPDLTFCAGAKTRLHIASLSRTDDVHTVKFHGQSFKFRNKRYDTLPVFSGVSLTAEIAPSEEGKWLFSSTSAYHIKGGMQALVTIKKCDNPRPIIDTSTKIRKYYISAESMSWNGQLRNSLFAYTNRKFDKEVQRSEKESYLGTVFGPVIKAEVGDVIKVVFYNKLNKTLAIKPAGLRTNKEYEGLIYNDNVSGKIQTAPGEKRTYYWFLPEFFGPVIGEDMCIPRYYYVDLDREPTMVGSILICQQYALDHNDNQVIGGEDFFLFVLPSIANTTDINGLSKKMFPTLHLCTGETNRFHFITLTNQPVTLISKSDPFVKDGSSMSAVGLIPHLPTSVTLQLAQEGVKEVNSFPDEILGFSLNVSRCGRSITNEEDFKEIEEVTYLGIIKDRWDYVDRRYRTKWKRFQTGDMKMSPRYIKAMFGYLYPNSNRLDFTRRLNYQGYVGHVFYTSVGESLKINMKNIADRNFSIYVPGVIADFTDFLSPKNTRNITWNIPRSAGPGSGDAECIAKTYFSTLDIEKDISTGLIGPIIICNKGVKAATDFKHSIIFFGEVDESMSWYFKENVKRYGPGSNTNLNDTELINNNRIKVVNGMSEGTLPEISYEVGKSQFIHFFNIGFRFQSIHMSGVAFSKSSSFYVGYDVIALHPGTSASVKVTPKISGKWRLMGYTTDMHWNKFSATMNVPSITGGAN
ncbi:hephaestin-like [Mytilus californianus]|uniref:hephaestin-like n=1 Tax=Mytilus californianus TaxID=6549 RepID=UPI0022471D42|nr:hephaestin-like [Mytilus californianus]